MTPAHPNFTIRHARRKDAAAMKRVQKASVLALKGGVYSDEQVKAWAKLNVAYGMDELIDARRYYVLLTENRVIALGGWSPDDEDEQLAWIRAVFVHPDEARKGYGRRVVIAAETAARALGHDQYGVHASLNAEPFYAALGYNVVKRDAIRLAGSLTIDHAVMRKPSP